MLGPKEAADSAAPEILIARWDSTPMNLKDVLLSDAAAAQSDSMYLYRPPGSPLLQQLTSTTTMASLVLPTAAARAERYHSSYPSAPSPFAAVLVVPTAAAARIAADLGSCSVPPALDQSASAAMLRIPPPGFGHPAYPWQMPASTAVFGPAHDQLFSTQHVYVNQVIKLMNSMVLTSEEETLFREAYKKRFGLTLDHKIIESIACLDVKVDLILETQDKVLTSIEDVKEMVNPSKQKSDVGIFVVFGRKFDATKILTFLSFFGMGF